MYSSEWFLGGFGEDRAATIRLRTAMDVTSIESAELSEKSLTLSPNPASDIISMNIDIEEYTGKANIMISDVVGRILAMKNFDNLQSGIYNFNISEYENGVYFSRLVTEEGSRTIKFSVQH